MVIAKGGINMGSVHNKQKQYSRAFVNLDLSVNLYSPTCQSSRIIKGSLVEKRILQFPLSNFVPFFLLALHKSVAATFYATRRLLSALKSILLRLFIFTPENHSRVIPVRDLSLSCLKMELALSLGDAPKGLPILDKSPRMPNKEAGFCIALGQGLSEKASDQNRASPTQVEDETRASSDPPLQLDLLPFTPVPRPHPASHLRIPWLSDSLGSQRFSPDGGARALDVNRLPAAGAEEADDGTPLSSSPNSVSSFHTDFYMRSDNAGSKSKRELEGEGERTSSRASDDDENGSTRKKLRLSKEQSAFLEESFKEHTTLNPKQKLVLAKQLNLRPRQVEVWFQNRRARTKLKQTEVDCEYLKRCCETLTEENRRLHKELQELRALKTLQPFYMQLPATTLTMCPSCERVATNSSSSATALTTVTAPNNASQASSLVSLTNPRTVQPHRTPSS